MTTTASSGGTTTFADVNYSAPLPLPVGTRGLFEVEVIDPGEVRLIPQTELAKALCGIWLCMPATVSLTAISKEKNGHHSHLWDYDAEYVSFRFASRPHLSDARENENPLYRARPISHEEHDVALKAIEAHRAAKASAGAAKVQPGTRNTKPPRKAARVSPTRKGA